MTNVLAKGSPKSTTWWAVVLGLFAGAMLSRLVPHPSNWTAVGAFAIWSGFLFRDRWMAIAAPLVVLLVTDLILQAHPTMPWTFAACATITILARGFRVHKSGVRLLSASLVGSGLFFAISNFGVWYSTDFYAHTWPGLVSCFVAAVPFFSAQVVGDLIYCAIFAGVVHMAKLSESVPVTSRIS